MNRLDWTELLIRVLALITAVTSFLGLSQLTALLAMVTGAPDPGLQLPWPLIGALAVFAVFFPLAVSFLLWKKARAIARRTWPSAEQPGPPSGLAPATFYDIQVALFTLVGLYFLIASIPNLFNSIANLVLWRVHLYGTGSSAVDLPFMARFAGVALQFLLALYILASRRKLAQMPGDPSE